MKRLLLALAVIAGLAGVASAEYLDVYYLKGFTRAGSFISTTTDSIPFGTTFTSRWLPIHDAQMVNVFIRATTADSDSVVQIQFQSVDTTNSAVTIANIDTAVTETGNLGLGTAVYSNYVGSGGASWGPESRRTITVVPFSSSAVAFPYISQRWMRVKVIAPASNCLANSSAQACNSMHGVRIWVEVKRETAPKGADAYYPFNGTAAP